MKNLFGDSSAATWGAIILLILFSLLIVRPVSSSLLSWHRTSGVLQERKAEVKALHTENYKLKDELAFYETDQFIVEQARTFGMIMPGEQTYVLRELVHPESAGKFAITRLRNATVDHKLTSVSK